MSTPGMTDPATTPDTETNPFMGVLITVVMIFCLLLLVEGGVRLRQWWMYGAFTHQEKMTEFKPELGIDLPVAGFASRTIQINALGLRGPELTLPKPNGTLRLAFIGGSSTFCTEVSSNDAVWPHLVWERLQKQTPQRHMDYINAGVTAYSTKQSLIHLQKIVAPLQPDLIVILHGSNDMTLETRALAEKQGLTSKPFTHSWISNHSLFWFLVEKNLQIRSVQANKERLTSFPTDFGLPFEENLTHLIREAQKVSRLVAVSTTSQQIRKEHTSETNKRAAASSQYYMPFLSPEALLDAFDRYNAVIRRVARKTGALLLDIESRIPGDPEHFVDAVHFTDTGNRVMAEQVTTGILSSTRWQELVTNGTPNPPKGKRTP